MDNLKTVSDNINTTLNPSGGVGSVLVSNHNALEQDIIRKVGKYVGMPFGAINGNPATIPSGIIAFDGNMNAEIVGRVSYLTADGTSAKTILSFFSVNDVLHVKDFQGRSSYFIIDSKTENNTKSCVELGLTPLAENGNFSYSGTEMICVVEIINRSASYTPTLNEVLDESEIEDGQPNNALLTDGEGMKFWGYVNRMTKATDTSKGIAVTGQTKTDLVIEKSVTKNISVSEVLNLNSLPGCQVLTMTSNTMFSFSNMIAEDESTVAEFLLMGNFAPSWSGATKSLESEDYIPSVSNTYRVIFEIVKGGETPMIYYKYTQIA